MYELKDIEDNYKKMTDEYLIDLAKKPQDIRLDILPLLQKELLVRSLNEEAMYITDFLVKSKEESRYKNMTDAELKKLIAQRIDSGESLESIKIDLKDDGVNIFDIIDKNSKLKNKAIDYLAQLKKEGYQETEIEEKLKETLSIEKIDTLQLRNELKKRGKINLIWGSLITILALLIMSTSFFVGDTITIGSFAFIVLGIWKLHQGYEQLKN
jgi:hypothetical protein